MNIYSILASKEHNIHYLNRYIKFIEKCKQNNLNYNLKFERHHICPKAKDMFPEYRNLKINKWNCLNLTPRQHFIAHMILWKTYSKFKSQTFALWAMKFKNGEKINSKLYEKLKLETTDHISTMNSSKIWINDGNKSKIIHEHDLDKYIPSGWIIGRIFSDLHKSKISNNAKERYKDKTKNPRYKAVITPETRQKISAKNKGKILSDDHKQKISNSSKGSKRSQETKEKMKRDKGSEIFITDGISNKRIKINTEIPSGWYRGMTKSLKT